MAAPELTAAEESAIAGAIASIEAAQADREVKLRAGDDAGLVALGIAPELAAAARAAGFESRVDEYQTGTESGWVLVLRLERGGVLYEMAHNSGPETWRAHPWAEVPTWR